MKISLVLALCLLSCISGALAESGPPRSDPIKIGATLALTGKYAAVGTTERDGLLMAVDEINAAGGVVGRQMHLLIEDNCGEPKTAVSSVAKLFDADHIDILYAAFTHITWAIKDIAAKQHKVMLYQSTVPEITAASPYFFRDYINIGADARALAKLMRAAGYEETIYLRDDGDSCQFHEQAFRRAAEEAQLRVNKWLQFSSGETDLKPLLLRVRSENPRVLTVCAWRDTQVLMKQLHELGMLRIQTFQTLAPFFPPGDTAEVRRLLEDNRAFSTWYGLVESTASPRQRAFLDKFEARFGYVPRPDASIAYDHIYALAQALPGCFAGAAIDEDCLRIRLLTSDFVGVGGSFRFDATRNSNRKSLAMQVRGGQWIEVPVP
jgi:branched-chain amino acid transport system substrate-binding protein